MPILKGNYPDVGIKDDKNLLKNVRDNIMQLRDELNYILEHLDETNIPELTDLYNQLTDINNQITTINNTLSTLPTGGGAKSVWGSLNL